MEPVELAKPRKRRHRLLCEAAFPTRRRPGLREFINKLPQIITFSETLPSLGQPLTSIGRPLTSIGQKLTSMDVQSTVFSSA